jgi:tetratricopeptide (TPR) repeat protein
MTTLLVVPRTMTGSELGPENPLPPFGTLSDIQNIPAGPGVPEDMKRNMTYGMRPNPLPYTIQDGYSRQKKALSVKTIVLENEFLRATFLPEYGGRLWSLFDKIENRDIIYENPVIQPANLAIRNAWLSGGVEWNIGLRGHSPFTCSSVFAARIKGDSDLPVLRIYEYERIRQVPYFVDFILPQDSRLLYVYAHIFNPHDSQIPMYWWSNIAFPEDPQTRVVAPADKAFRFGYGHRGLHLRDVPEIEGVDVSYSTNLKHSADFFFDIPASDRKWIAGIDRDGAGLFHTSVDRLLGRKLFVWGDGSGGKAWQPFLSVPGKPYIEIQAGLAHTQMEHLPMPPKAEWSWLEAYGYIKTDPTIIHGDDWRKAYREVDEVIEKILPRQEMKERYRAAETSAGFEIDEVLHEGSGWGQLESEFRAKHDLEPLCGSGLDFSRDFEPGQRQWNELLNDGTFPTPDPLEEPVGYEVEPKWREMLETYVAQEPDNWYAWLHLGLMQFGEKSLDLAAESWKRSLSAAPNPWAYRNLALLAKLQDDLDTAAHHYSKAYELTKNCTPLTIEYGYALLDAGKASTWLTIYDALSIDLRQMGRLQLLHARGLLESGRYDEALAVIDSKPEVTDLREGENSLTDIWYQIHEKKLVASGEAPVGDLRSYVQDNFPPPAQIDFRMRTKKDEAR